MSARNFLARADTFHRKALAEFLAAKSNGMREADLVQAAEKGWLAAHRATNALLEYFGKKVTSGTHRKEQDLFQLERRIPRLREADILDQFTVFHSRLHVSAGYMDTVSAKLLDRDLRALGEYIRTIKHLIGR